MTTYLVTGGAGFIGSTLVRQLIDEPATSVVNLDKLTYAGNLESLGDVLIHPRHQFVPGDISDAAAVRALLAEHRPAGVFHLAAESHVDRSIDQPAQFIQTNLVGTFTLLDACLDYWRTLDVASQASFRFLHASSDEVFGSLAANGYSGEDTPYDPSSPYSASKAGADFLARAWQRTYGLPVVVTNSSNVYGPYQFPEKLIPLMIQKAIHAAPLPVYGRGENVRDWLHVDDQARALRCVMAAGVPGRTYYVGARNERRNIDLVRNICGLLDEFRPDPAGPHERLISFVADRPGHDLRYAVDGSRLRAELGWQPRRTFEAGLRGTVTWYLAHQDWVARVVSGAYRGERLGPRS